MTACAALPAADPPDDRRFVSLATIQWTLRRIGPILHYEAGRQGQKHELVATVGEFTMALEQELRVYRATLGDLLGVGDVNEGKYTAIKGDRSLGVFDGYEDALKAAYEAFGLGPFLVKKIERHESSVFFARPIG
jgi:hypothetical protein